MEICHASFKTYKQDTKARNTLGNIFEVTSLKETLFRTQVYSYVCKNADYIWWSLGIKLFSFSSSQKQKKSHRNRKVIRNAKK